MFWSINFAECRVVIDVCDVPEMHVNAMIIQVLIIILKIFVANKNECNNEDVIEAKTGDMLFLN